MWQYCIILSYPWYKRCCQIEHHKAALCVKHMQVFGNTCSNLVACQWSAISPPIVRPKWNLSFWLSAPLLLLLLAVTVSLHVYLSSVALSDPQWQWKTGPAATCGTSQSPYGSQPWSRRVAVFCSHGSQTCSGELGPHCEGHDFMFCSPPPHSGSYWLHVVWRHRSSSP